MLHPVSLAPTQYVNHKTYAQEILPLISCATMWSLQAELEQFIPIKIQRMHGTTTEPVLILFYRQRGCICCVTVQQMVTGGKQPKHKLQQPATIHLEDAKGHFHSLSAVKRISSGQQLDQSVLSSQQPVREC